MKVPNSSAYSVVSDANSDVGASSPSGGQSGAPAPGTLKAPLGPPSTCGVPGKSI